MRINKNYLSRFKKYKYGYMYMVKSGLFLLFDLDTLEYKEVVSMYSLYKQKDVDIAINRLISLDYLEV